MFRSMLIATAVAAALAVSAPAALAQREVTNAGDPWVHAPTGTPFPLQIGAFERGRVTEYSDDGSDASATYHARRPDGSWASVTLYIYPTTAGMGCQQVFDEVKANVESHRGAELVSEGRTQAPAGEGGPAALYARYAVPAGGMGEGLGPTRSDAYLYCPTGAPWLVKYRATWSAEADFSREVEDLLHAIAWPADLAGRAAAIQP